ncbi:MAG: hypothetical protein SW833_24765 [Cyanobacteriota bacterium]|nr:hypothetical protein [Cyanobacteriota bacterium]
MSRDRNTLMVWPEFNQRFIPDFQKTYGRLPTPEEITQAEANFRQYLRSQGFIPEDERPPLASQKPTDDEKNP